jgi:cytochrome c-type biogenesis protein CcmH
LSGSLASFLPGIVVLAVGLAAGVVLAARLRRDRRAGAAVAMAGAVDQRDLDLERADLEARRAEIYARLRGDGGDELGEAERRELERSAARALRRLEELDARAVAPRRRDAGAAAAASAGAAARPQRAHAGAVGFAFGAGFAALAALLVYWVARDATPRPSEASPPMAAAPAAEDPDHERLDQLAPEAKARVGALMTHLEQQPDDIDARKALAEAFVVEGLFFEAFEQSERILAQRPGDVDGLYFQGLIRLTMGQDSTAIELLDRALASEPGFVSARLVRGLARLRLGQREAAVEDWQAGLEAAGGHHRGLERLLELAASGASAEEILASPPRGDQEADPGAEASRQAAQAPASGGAYRARLELSPGTAAPPGAILFVNLRVVAGAGPPAAVKRVESPQFPLELTLDGSDAMPGLEGRPLPDRGVISARLDRDGNASTRDPSEPSAQSEAVIGVPLTLVLR